MLSTLALIVGVVGLFIYWRVTRIRYVKNYVMEDFVVFDELGEAMEHAKTLLKMADEKGSISIVDYFETAGIEHTSDDHDKGWTKANITKIGIAEVDYGYIVVMPRVEHIKGGNK